jgi:hypothetical protein
MELLVAVFTLLVTLYAVIPRARQLDLNLRLNSLDWLALTLGFLVATYLQFYTFFEVHQLALSRSDWPRGLSPENFTYVVILILVAFLGLRVRFVTLSRRRIYKFQELAEQLLWSETYAELISLFDRHLHEFFRIYYGNYALGKVRLRLARNIAPRIEDLIVELDGQGERDRPKEGRTRHRKQVIAPPTLVRLLLIVLPDYSQEQDAAQETARSVLLSPGFVDALARSRPYLGLEIIRIWRGHHDQFEFVDLYITRLVENEASVFYRELANNQNMTAGSRYKLPTTNRFLYFFLHDAEQAKHFHVYKAIGNYVLRELDKLGRDPESDPYNQAMGDFEQVEAWHSPVFGAIRFFDIMVMEALYQGTEWHMWLYYFPLFMKKIVRNYRLSDPLADPTAEWPIRYSFLIYEMFSALRKWIAAVEDVPLAQRNVILQSTRVDHENGNIPKSAIIALGQCVRGVLKSDNLGEKFQRSLLDMVFHLYFELQRMNGGSQYATVLFEALRKGGTWKPHDDDVYNNRLADAFDELKSEYYVKYDDAEVEKVEKTLRPGT